MDDALLKRINLLPLTAKLAKREIVSWVSMPTVIDAKDCVSSNVKAYGWHQESSTLKVIFTNGVEYRYLGVEDKVYEELHNAQSKGSALAMIRRVYQAVKIDDSFYAA